MGGNTLIQNPFVRANYYNEPRPLSVEEILKTIVGDTVQGFILGSYERRLETLKLIDRFGYDIIPPEHLPDWRRSKLSEAYQAFRILEKVHSDMK